MKREAIRVRFEASEDDVINSLADQTGLKKIDIIRLLVRDGLKTSGWAKEVTK